jgi:hypothetical protein
MRADTQKGLFQRAAHVKPIGRAPEKGMCPIHAYAFSYPSTNGGCPIRNAGFAARVGYHRSTRRTVPHAKIPIRCDKAQTPNKTRNFSPNKTRHLQQTPP